MQRCCQEFEAKLISQTSTLRDLGRAKTLAESKLRAANDSFEVTRRRLVNSLCQAELCLQAETRLRIKAELDLQEATKERVSADDQVAGLKIMLGDAQVLIQTLKCKLRSKDRVTLAGLPSTPTEDHLRVNLARVRAEATEARNELKSVHIQLADLEKQNAELRMHQSALAANLGRTQVALRDANGKVKKLMANNRRFYHRNSQLQASQAEPCDTRSRHRHGGHVQTKRLRLSPIAASRRPHDTHTSRAVTCGTAAPEAAVSDVACACACRTGQQQPVPDDEVAMEQEHDTTFSDEELTRRTPSSPAPAQSCTDSQPTAVDLDTVRMRVDEWVDIVVARRQDEDMVVVSRHGSWEPHVPHDVRNVVDALLLRAQQFCHVNLDARRQAVLAIAVYTRTNSRTGKLLQDSLSTSVSMAHGSITKMFKFLNHAGLTSCHRTHARGLTGLNGAVAAFMTEILGVAKRLGIVPALVYDNVDLENRKLGLHFMAFMVIFILPLASSSSPAECIPLAAQTTADLLGLDPQMTAASKGWKAEFVADLVDAHRAFNFDTRTRSAPTGNRPGRKRAASDALDANAGMGLNQKYPIALDDRILQMLAGQEILEGDTSTRLENTWRKGDELFVTGWLQSSRLASVRVPDRQDALVPIAFFTGDPRGLPPHLRRIAGCQEHWETVLELFKSHVEEASNKHLRPHGLRFLHRRGLGFIFQVVDARASDVHAVREARKRVLAQLGDMGAHVDSCDGQEFRMLLNDRDAARLRICTEMRRLGTALENAALPPEDVQVLQYFMDSEGSKLQRVGLGVAPALAPLHTLWTAMRALFGLHGKLVYDAVASLIVDEKQWSSKISLVTSATSRMGLQIIEVAVWSWVMFVHSKLDNKDMDEDGNFDFERWEACISQYKNEALYPEFSMYHRALYDDALIVLGYSHSHSSSSRDVGSLRAGIERQMLSLLARGGRYYYVDIMVRAQRELNLQPDRLRNAARSAHMAQACSNGGVKFKPIDDGMEQGVASVKHVFTSGTTVEQGNERARVEQFVVEPCAVLHGGEEAPVDIADHRETFNMAAASAQIVACFQANLRDDVLGFGAGRSAPLGSSTETEVPVLVPNWRKTRGASGGPELGFSIKSRPVQVSMAYLQQDAIGKERTEDVASWALRRTVGGSSGFVGDKRPSSAKIAFEAGQKKKESRQALERAVQRMRTFIAMVSDPRAGQLAKQPWGVATACRRDGHFVLTDSNKAKMESYYQTAFNWNSQLPAEATVKPQDAQSRLALHLWAAGQFLKVDTIIVDALCACRFLPKPPRQKWTGAHLALWCFVSMVAKHCGEGVQKVELVWDVGACLVKKMTECARDDAKPAQEVEFDPDRVVCNGTTVTQDFIPGKVIPDRDKGRPGFLASMYDALLRVQEQLPVVAEILQPLERCMSAGQQVVVCGIGRTLEERRCGLVLTRTGPGFTVQVNTEQSHQDDDREIARRAYVAASKGENAVVVGTDSDLWKLLALVACRADANRGTGARPVGRLFMKKQQKSGCTPSYLDCSELHGCWRGVDVSEPTTVTKTSRVSQVTLDSIGAESGQEWVRTLHVLTADILNGSDSTSRLTPRRFGLWALLEFSDWIGLLAEPVDSTHDEFGRSVVIHRQAARRFIMVCHVLHRPTVFLDRGAWAGKGHAEKVTLLEVLEEEGWLALEQRAAQKALDRLQEYIENEANLELHIQRAEARLCLWWSSIDLREPDLTLRGFSVRVDGLGCMRDLKMSRARAYGSISRVDPDLAGGTELHTLLDVERGNEREWLMRIGSNIIAQDDPTPADAEDSEDGVSSNGAATGSPRATESSIDEENVGVLRAPSETGSIPQEADRAERMLQQAAWMGDVEEVLIDALEAHRAHASADEERET